LAVAFEHVGRQREDRHVLHRVDLAQPRGAVVAVDVRQVNVHQHKVRVARLRQLQPTQAGVRLDNLIALGHQHTPDEQPVVEVVMHVEDASKSHGVRSALAVVWWRSSTNGRQEGARNLYRSPLVGIIREGPATMYGDSHVDKPSTLIRGMRGRAAGPTVYPLRRVRIRVCRLALEPPPNLAVTKSPLG